MDDTRKIEIADRLAAAKRDLDSAKERFDLAESALAKSPKFAEAIIDRERAAAAFAGAKLVLDAGGPRDYAREIAEDYSRRLARAIGGDEPNFDCSDQNGCGRTNNPVGWRSACIT